jgi:hypothetical protein
VSAPRYGNTIGELSFDGNTIVKSDALRLVFKIGARTAARKRFVKGFMKAREAYSASGYFEFTGYPDFEQLQFLAADDVGSSQGVARFKLSPFGGAEVVDETSRSRPRTVRTRPSRQPRRKVFL